MTKNSEGRCAGCGKNSYDINAHKMCPKCAGTAPVGNGGPGSGRKAGEASEKAEAASDKAEKEGTSKAHDEARGAHIDASKANLTAGNKIQAMYHTDMTGLHDRLEKGLKGGSTRDIIKARYNK